MKVYEIEITYTCTSIVSVVAPNEEIARTIAIAEDDGPDQRDLEVDCVEVEDEYEITDASDIPDDAIRVTCKVCQYAVKGICECPKHLYQLPIAKLKGICENFT